MPRTFCRRWANGWPPATARDRATPTPTCGGLALANAKLGAVHGFAGPIGGMFDAPHGAVCARLLPLVMEANVNALQEREPESPALSRYAEVAVILTGEADATVADGVAWVQALCDELAVPGFASYGMADGDLVEVVGPLGWVDEIGGQHGVEPVAAEVEPIGRLSGLVLNP